VPRPRVNDSALFATLTFVCAAVLSVGVAVIVAIAAVLPAAIAHPNTPKDELTAAATTYPVLLTTIIATQLALLLVIVIAWWLTGQPFRSRLGLVRPRVSAADMAAIVLAGGFPFVLAIAAAGAASKVLPSFGQGPSIIAIWRDSSMIQSIAWVLAIGALPGVIEELLFRGLILTAYKRRFRPGVAIALSTLLFALLHLDPPAMALALVLGAWFGVIAHRTKSVVLTVATHATVNSGWNAAMMVAHQQGLSETTQSIMLAVVALVSLPFFVVAVKALRSRIIPPELA